jgi:hypothetical protein
MPLATGWVSFGLGRFRDTGFSTYTGMAYQSLPSLPADPPGGLHAWMRDLARHSPFVTGDPEVDTLSGDVPTDGHEAALPAQFTAFMADPLLRDSVPTCTACYWEAALPVSASPVHEDAQLVRFLNDQQGCVFWYLHVLPDGQHEILCGAQCYDEYAVDPEEAATDLLRVADSFDEFIARFWIENLAWYEIEHLDRADEELSAPVLAYVRQLEPSGRG